MFVANQSVQAVNCCHTICCNFIKLYIFCFRSKMMRHCKSLISNSLSFTEGLITCLFTTDVEAPALSRSVTTSLWPANAAW